MDTVRGQVNSISHRTGSGISRRSNNSCKTHARITLSLASKKDYKKLQTIQNCALRCVFKLPKRSNVDSYHCKIRTLHVDNRRYLLLMMYMYRLTLARDFCPASSQALHTRSSVKLNFHLIRPKNSEFEKSPLSKMLQILTPSNVY